MRQARYLYSELGNLVQARINCDRAVPRNTEWYNKHSTAIANLVERFMPHGSGFDNGTQIDLEASHATKLVFHTAFHHMNESGMYDGWTEHTVTVTPAFDGINLRVSGRNQNGIKDYIGDCFSDALTTRIVWSDERQVWTRETLHVRA